jgi:hypothetical protein
VFVLPYCSQEVASLLVFSRFQTCSFAFWQHEVGFDGYNTHVSVANGGKTIMHSKPAASHSRTSQEEVDHTFVSSSRASLHVHCSHHRVVEHPVD